MRVILQSNVPHYHHLARSLETSGNLERYITTISLQTAAAPRWLPAARRKKLEARRLTTIPRNKVRQLWFPEIVQHALPMARLADIERANAANNFLFDWMAMRSVEDCDVFHFVSSIGLHCARKAKHRGARVVCDIRQAHPKVQNEVLREEGLRSGRSFVLTGWSYESRVIEELTLADYIIVPSEYARRTFLGEGFDPQRVLANPYGVDLSCFEPTDPPGGVFRIICAGRVAPIKGILYLLQAVKELNLPNLQVLLVGSMDPDMELILSSYSGYFEHRPAISRADLARSYQESSVLILPTLSDSFGLVVVEAMASGRPVIVSDQAGASETVRDGVDGFIVRARDVDQLKEKILLLYEDTELRAAMGRAAAQRAREMTWENYGRRAVEFYQRLERVH